MLLGDNLEFFKYQACGNDYVYIDCFDRNISNPDELAKKISDRNFGVGSDGIILIMPPSNINSDAKMRIFNSDGSEAEMCGNGIRCVGKYVFDNKKNSQKNIARIETLAGIKILELIESSEKISKIKVSMGTPEFLGNFYLEEIKNISKKNGIYISVGNPHFVIFCENIDINKINIENIGKKIQNSRYFKNGVNIEFVEIKSKNNIKIRVFERGSGETLACGTGACASAFAAILQKYCDEKQKIIVNLKGGKLEIEFINNKIYMTGEAVKVFKGEYYD
ncbi:MAG: diaminopimelate epimerase [Clostridia bacterium]|nr:diaminopimelate epimerase [Clostridia bacterium]